MVSYLSRDRAMRRHNTGSALNPEKDFINPPVPAAHGA